MRLFDAGTSRLQGLPAGRLLLARVPVGLPVGAADLVALSALTDALEGGRRQPLARRVLALQPFPAGQLVLAAAGLPLGLGARQAAAAAVRAVAAGAAGAGAAGDVAARRTLARCCCFELRVGGKVSEVKEHGGEQ